MEKFISQDLFIFKCKWYVKFLEGIYYFWNNIPKPLLTDLNERENSGNLNKEMPAAGKMF
jgi:hypothetical protein